VLLGLAALLAAPPPSAAVVTIDWVQVGNPGNPPDTFINCSGPNFSGSSTCGQVDYTYYISKYDTTNAQYAEFLNAVDPNGTNTLGLWNTYMQASDDGGISFVSGNASGSKYVVKSGFANDPVVWDSFYDALRFANWLNNGQGSNSTETGAYTLMGGTPTPSNGDAVTRNAGANVFLPSENEWYKAAYYDPISGSYFAFPYGTSTPTVCAAPGATPNTANCEEAVGHVTPVGAYTGSMSPYGTFDQGGDVFQWTEQSVSLSTGYFRVIRGGSWDYVDSDVAARVSLVGPPPAGVNNIGFRVASLGLAVGIEVEPNPIALNLPISVTVLGSTTVDVTKMDVTTLRFGPKGATPVSTQIVSQNGQVDLVASFDVQDTGLTIGDTQACMQGTIDGQLFTGCAPVVIVNVACALGFELAPILPALLWLRGRRRRRLA